MDILHIGTQVKEKVTGVSTFCKGEPVYVQRGLGIDKYDREGRVLMTEHEIFDFIIFIFQMAKKMRKGLNISLTFYDDLLPIINDQVDSGNNVIIAGDWNTAHLPIDLARPKENKNTSGLMQIERDKIDLYISNSWIDTFGLFHDEGERYSWWTYRFGARERNVGWRIDYFFVNEGMVEICKDADIHQNIFGSDHCPVSLMLDL